MPKGAPKAKEPVKIQDFLPFLRWFPLSLQNCRADLIAGVTVALVIIPQSMAYANLAGLPPYVGLYAAFLPVIVAALWGSSNQLSTGPVAMSSLLTASALIPLAAPGSPEYLELAMLIAIVAGIIRVALGTFHLGMLVNFISHPVVVGFTNAAAIVICLSQLDKLLGIQRIRSANFLSDIWELLHHLENTHFPTLCIGVFALVTILTLKKIWPQFRGVLVVMPITIIVSWLIGFENRREIALENIGDAEVKRRIVEYAERQTQIDSLRHLLTHFKDQAEQAPARSIDVDEEKLLEQQHVQRLNFTLEKAENENKYLLYDLRQEQFRQVVSDNVAVFYRDDQIPESLDQEGGVWYLIGIANGGELTISSGGSVVGHVQAGLPELRVPKLDLGVMLQLVPSALVLVLVGFMEAVSIAKAIATKTRQRFSINQELIGTGMGNIVGGLFSGYPVGGSFSRSALNLSMGAKSGLSSVFTGLVVMVTLLFFTRIFYHLPQAVLAVVIINAVIGLINFKPILLAWQAKKLDAMIAIITFFATLMLAPQLQYGIYVGAGLSVVFYLTEWTKPRAVILGRHRDGTLRDAVRYNLPTCEHIAIFRFDSSLEFTDVSYFEDTILEVVANRPKLKFIHVVADGVNAIDASGVEMLRNVHRRLLDSGVQMVFSDLKRQVSEILAHTGFIRTIGHRNIYRTKVAALEGIFERIDADDFDPEKCPLRAKKKKRTEKNA